MSEGITEAVAESFLPMEYQGIIYSILIFRIILIKRNIESIDM